MLKGMTIIFIRYEDLKIYHGPPKANTSQDLIH